MSSTYTSRKELRTEKFTITNTIWTRHRLNTKKRVGCMNQIFKQYYNENKDIFEQLTADDFVEYYFSKCITKKQFFQTVFCKPFLHKIAKSFCRLLHLHFVGNCKTTAGSYSASHKPLQIIFSCYNTRYGNGSSEFSSSCACSLK